MPSYNAPPTPLAIYDDDLAKFADLILVCDGEQTVRTHALLLAAHSPIVQKLLETESSRPLHVDVRPASRKCALAFRSFVTKGSLDITAADAASFITIASKLQIESILRALESDVVGKFISSDTALAYLLVGRREGSSALIGAATAFIQRNAAACFATPSLFDLDLDTLLMLLKDDNLSIREEDLFRHCLAWADTRSHLDSAATTQPFGSAASEGGHDGGGAGSDASSAAPASQASAQPPAKGVHVARKSLRESLLNATLPYIRFPIMGAQVFARTVVPTDVLPTSEVSNLLMYFMVPDIAAKTIKHNMLPRTGTGSKFTWARTCSNEAGVLSLSNDCRTISFRHMDQLAALSSIAAGAASAPAAAAQQLLSQPTMLVTEQAFGAGLATVYITTWGCKSATIGCIVSGLDYDDGDCAMMSAEHATPSDEAFEGLTITDSGDVTANTHKGRVAVHVIGESAGACLRDGCPLVLTVDWDLHRLEVAIHHKGAAAPVHVATVAAIPSRPLRLALGAVAKPSGGDVDAFATINSNPPAYLKEQAKVTVLGTVASTPSTDPALAL